MLEKSRELFHRAQKIIPGGVNSPVRAFKAVGGYPPFIKRGYGSKIEDADGNVYIDYLGSWGPLILGHACPEVIEAIKNAAENGTSFGAPTALEVEMAEMITSAFPSVEMVRMVNSGTEAAMSAIRLARAFTGRTKIVKFAGCYHGHVDSLLVDAGSGVATFVVPASKGVPDNLYTETIVLPFNNIEPCKEVFSTMGDEIAGVIVELVPANMGVVLPDINFLKDLRTITNQYGSLLIADEVITGFRVAWGGAQTLFHIDADLTCFGKIIGGGLPVGAYGGKKNIMEQVSPLGEMYQAGTLSGNPLAMAAGLAVLKKLKDEAIYTQIDTMGRYFCNAVAEQAKSSGVPVSVQRCGSMFTVFFTDSSPVCYKDVKRCNRSLFKKYYHAMLAGGVYLPPSPFETAFISASHTSEDLAKTIETVKRAFAIL